MNIRFFISVAVALFACAPLNAQDGIIKVGTYNLRVQNADKGTPDRWELRKDKLFASILENDFDVFGVQEVCDFAQSDISAGLRKIYGAIFFSPYKIDGNGDKASGILYKKSRFKLLKYHYFWLSDTPDEVSANDHNVYGTKAVAYNRGGACAVFKDKKTGKKIFFMNCHGILNKEESLRYAHVLEDLEKKYNPEGLPSFMVGDLNARVDNPVHQIWRQYWNDAADNFGERQCTMNGFSTDPSAWDKAKHIDFVYYRNVAAPEVYVVNQKLYDGRCASDHFPVCADFKL